MNIINPPTQVQVPGISEKIIHPKIAIIGSLINPIGSRLVISALALSVNALIVKKLTLTDTPHAIIIWMVVMLIPITLIPAIPVWEWPSLEAWLYLWGIAILGTLAHFSWTKSYALADITSLEPIGFIKLPIMALLGWMIFTEIPGTWTWVGGLIIFMSTIYISQREAKASNSLKPNDGFQVPKL